MTAEEQRLEQARRRTKHWKRWGPYLSERAWGTVREDYSPYGNAWEYLPHDHARSRAYRWNEDGIAGICDRHQYICFAIAMWNGRDPILKERLFGLTGNEGNHGEDVKECYFYLDSTPTHSYMKYLYKYPQAAFPYSRLVEENRHRGRHDPEFELMDSGVFDENRYFDVFVEYAKATPEDLCIRIQVVNRGPGPGGTTIGRPRLRQGEPLHRVSVIETQHEHYGLRRLLCEGEPTLLFTENETNTRRLYGDQDGARYVKDSFHDYVVLGEKGAVNPDHLGTKAAAQYVLALPPGETKTIRLRFTNEVQTPEFTKEDFETVFTERLREANAFYDRLAPATLSEDARRGQRQAFAGLLWSKQFYHYEVNRWLKGDPIMPDPPHERLAGRNADWTHLYNADVISMPDKWEYPWYAAWDLAFHCIPLALVDSTFAKEQLVLMLREWYMHPNGQIPAYEWAFGDVNPPVHAWAAWRVYKIEKKRRGAGDTVFLKRVFQKLLLNFTWWVNRKDADGMNIFQVGFLGLDNIGVFDRPHEITMPQVQFWFLFVDLDGDGNIDLCTDDSSSGVNYYRNDGTAQNPNFVLQVHTMVDSAGDPMFAGFSSIPAFVDLNGDSVVDFLSSNSANGSINYYQNVGSKSLPLFKLISTMFQNITVIGDTCFSSSTMPKKNAHGAGAYCFADVDGNGTPDMFYGDLFSHSIFYMENTGTSKLPLLQCTSNRYPTDGSLVTFGFNQATFADIDGDGDLDLFDGVLNNMQRHGFWYYKNTGSPAAPDFQFQTKDYLSMIDVGSYSHPTLVDIDGDTDLDLIVGNLDGQMRFFRNNGTPATPSFSLVDTMFAGISGNYSYAPTFIDIDHDGDKDLFLGRFDGHIKFYRNNGAVSTPQFILSVSPVDTIKVSQNAVPAFVDIDGDGDVDLFVGKGNGQISFYRNDGSDTNFIPIDRKS